MPGSSISPQSCIACTVEILQSCTMPISTVLYHIYWLPFEILQSYLHYVIDNSNQGVIPNWSYNQIEYNGDEIIEITNRNRLTWIVTLQITSQTLWRAHRLYCELMFDAEKRLLPEFSKYKFGGQLRPTNTAIYDKTSVAAQMSRRWIKGMDECLHHIILFQSNFLFIP